MLSVMMASNIMCLLYKSNFKISNSVKCYLLRENLNGVKGGNL